MPCAEPALKDAATMRNEAENPAASVEVARMLEEEEREKELFGTILSAAREEGVSLDALHARTSQLAAPLRKLPPQDASVPQENDGDRWNSDLDNDGNPRWITLPAPQDDGTGGARGGQDRHHAPSSAIPSGFHKPRPLRGLFRMVVVSAVLGLLYYALSRTGLVPRFF